MISLTKSFYYFMPSIFGLLITFLVFCNHVLFAGHANIYHLKTSVYYNDSHFLLSQQLSLEQVFYNQSFRLFSVGLMSSRYTNSLYYQFGLEYGGYKYINGDSKLIGSIFLDKRFSKSNALESSLYVSAGYLRRINDRYLYSTKLSYSILSINSPASIILSFSVNYFHGKGVSYRETSPKLKRVKRRILWFLWIND